MRPSSIKYYFKEGISSMIKNRLMTVAAIGTVAACIFIVSLSYCLMQNLSHILEQIEDTIGVAIFLEEDVTADDVAEIRDEVSEIPHITMVTYISPEEALEELKGEWGEDGILDGFDGDNNPLSHSFEIAIDDIENQESVLSALERVDLVTNVRHAQAETDVILSINQGIVIIGGSIIGILAIISVVIIMNTIKISVYGRRNEINIMKFVGATDWFIRWPFIIEGTLIGVLGSIIPILISIPMYNKGVEMVTEYLPVITNIGTLLTDYTIFMTLAPASIGFGIFLGIFGSVFSIRKHLRV